VEGVWVPIEALTSSIGLSPRRVVEALRPLHHYGLIEFAENDAIIGVSGVVPSLSPRLALRLSRYPVEVLAALEAREVRWPAEVRRHSAVGWDR